jgi:hypothetical protein
MRKAALLVACLLSVSVLGCRPHPGHVMRGLRMEHRNAERGERAEHRGLRRVCRSDIEQFCASDQTGRDRRMCLESHLDKLSADCKTAVEARMHRGRRNRDKDDRSNADDQDDN